MATTIQGKVKEGTFTVNSYDYSVYHNMDSQGKIEGYLQVTPLHLVLEMNHSVPLREAMKNQVQKGFDFELSVLDEKGKVEHSVKLGECKVINVSISGVRETGSRAAVTLIGTKVDIDKKEVYNLEKVLKYTGKK